ncbi:tRNA lysidine(34) synthetase TilS [candidate division Kazan bacterium RBG_13_50_9]|uniref:tRNA(Ile)-lysidine synthase n=1 Tax=candidate division Kazan bacterium RBG_13_50_9 TaxID=1798535 RepID=A0A1F4NSC7_UNCK3|nr:MAG: tRNA lysidine(34) synthetase TilS [candidate division Kazan bacterium RBG_13_50_9]
MELVESVRKQVAANRFPPKGAILVVAVSGGVDSVALLHILLPLAGHYSWRLVVAHLNHKLRQEAKRDAQFVEQLAQQLGLKFVGGTAEVRREAKSCKLTLEEAGRTARYRFLRRVASRYRAAAIVMAHTADDQAETIVMNWLRGAAVRGLAGMRGLERGIWRPLLGVEKRALQRFAKEYKLAYREDRSNRELNYTRNQIRHQALPLLERINPGLRNMLLRSATTFAALEDFVAQMVKDVFHKLAIKGRGRISFHRAAFSKLHAFIQDELLLYAIEYILGSRQGFKKVHISEMRRVVDSPKKVSSKQLPAKLFLIKTCDKITISRYRPKNL